MDWGAIVAGAVAGLGSGVVASLIAPWVQLAVEKRRDRRRRRRELIDSWRAMVARHHAAGYTLSDLVDDPGYLSLRARLSADVRTRLEAMPGTEVNPIEVRVGAKGVSARPDLDLVLREIDRLEQAWDLD